jgi:STE24 endopeptidase
VNEPRAVRYQRLKRRTAAVSFGSASLVLTTVAAPAVSRRLADFSLHAAAVLPGVPAHLGATIVFVAVLVVAWEAAALPAVAWFALRVQRGYGRDETAGVDEVIVAHARAALVLLPAALAAAALVLATARLTPRWWWAPTGCGLAIGLLAALRGGPVLLSWLAPVRPIARRDLADRLVALSGRARMPVAGIDEWLVADGAAATALVTGLGRSRRILLASDLARHWTDDEIAVVVAHELAHHVYGDLWRTLVLQAALLVTALGASQLALARFGSSMGVSGAADLAALPIVALVSIGCWVASAPLRHAQSRRQERRADLFALAMTNGVEAFGSAVRRLGALYLAEDRPSALTRLLFHHHPSVSERLAMAESYRRLRP